MVAGAPQGSVTGMRSPPSRREERVIWVAKGPDEGGGGGTPSELGVDPQIDVVAHNTPNR